MNYFALILPKLVSFLILLSVGYFVAWRGILRREGMASIAALLIRVVLPCLSADLLIEQGIDAASLAVYLISRRFVPEYLSIFLMLGAGAPVMSTSCTICRQYALDEEYAAAAVFVTTLGCMASIPLLFGAISLLG